MMKSDILNQAAAAAATAPEGTVKLTMPAGWLPWNDFTAGTRYLGAMAVMSVKVPTGKSTHHVVVGARLVKDQLEWGIWCGDSYLEGRNKLTTPIAFPEGFLLDQDELLTQMDFKEGIVSPPAVKCDFWSSQSCVHTEAALAWLHTNPHLLEGIEALWATAVPVAKSATPAISRSWNNPTSYIFTPAQKPVLLMGDRGAGKTHFGRALAGETEATFVEVGLHEDVKASYLLGKLLPAPAGGFAWVDGPLSRAFRQAARGKKVLLLLDELLRTPQEQLSILLTALSPYKGKYTLSTSRVVGYDEDGVGVEEVLECDIGNLAVMATTNVGAHFVVGEIDPALMERFVVFKMDTTEEKLRDVLSKTCEARALPLGLVDKLIAFWKGANALVQNGQLQLAPTLRVLTRSLERINKAAELKESLMAEHLQWCALDSDGQIVEAHYKALEALAKAAKI